MSLALNSSNNANCVFCGSEYSSEYLKAQDIQCNAYNYRRCSQCGAVFQSPIPGPHILKDAYDDSYYGATESKFINPIETIIDYFRSSRARYVSKFLSSGDTVVDIGCGNGLFLKHLSQLGNYRLHGIEPPGKSCDRASRVPGVIIKKGFLATEDFTPQSVSVATMFHVLEHVENPRETLKTLATLIKTGGHLILSFPNIESYQARLFGKHWLHLDPPRHIWFPSVNHWHTLVSELGFKIIATRRISLEQNPFGFIQSVLNATLLPRDLLYERLKGNRAYAPYYGVISISFQKVVAALLTPLAIFLDFIESMLGHSATIEFTLQRK